MVWGRTFEIDGLGNLEALDAGGLARGLEIRQDGGGGEGRPAQGGEGLLGGGSGRWGESRGVGEGG